MTFSIIRFVGPLLVAGLLGACGHQAGSPSPPGMTVSTAQPVQKVFAHRVTAFGTAIGNPRHARHLSLAHGGEVVGVMVSDGQSVSAGQALLKMATAPAVRKAFKQAQSALVLARDQLARNKKLMAQHLATQAQVDGARKAVSDAEAALQAQREMGGGQPVDIITAPTAGVITRIQVTRGQRVPANTVLATFTPAHGLIAQLGVQPHQATGIESGMPVTLRAVYGSFGRAHGEVSMVGHAVDPTTHLVPVQVTLPTEWASHLVAGAALSARIDTSRHKAWAVPRKALQSDAHGNYIFQVEKGRAHRIDVKVVSPQGNVVGVTGELDASAPVITLGSYEVSDGEAVHARQSTSVPAHGASVQ